MTIIDATTLEFPETADDVLALFVSYAVRGDVITLHAASCPTTRDVSWACRCVPVSMTIGAEA